VARSKIQGELSGEGQWHYQHPLAAAALELDPSLDAARQEASAITPNRGLALLVADQCASRYEALAKVLAHGS
jgi:hypothetical protein